MFPIYNHTRLRPSSPKPTLYIILLSIKKYKQPNVKALIITYNKDSCSVDILP